MIYEKRPERIYRLSFSRVRQEADLGRFTKDQADVAVRVIHACGMTAIGSELEFSDGFESAGREALLRGAPIHCDGNMTAAGIVRDALPVRNRVIVSINSTETFRLAAEMGTTRSAAAVDTWLPELEGSVVAIGNAPTALFRLLEIVDGGGPCPSLVIGFPVGFVGATESKAELAARRRRFEFLTLPGTKGGSAMAAATVNAIAFACRDRMSAEQPAAAVERLD